MSIMGTNNLNTLDYNALIGSFINYEIILKSKGRIPKEEKALKVQTHIQGKEESRQESSLGDEEDKEL